MENYYKVGKLYELKENFSHFPDVIPIQILVLSKVACTQEYCHFIKGYKKKCGNERLVTIPEGYNDTICGWSASYIDVAEPVYKEIRGQ